jgi:HTH-type transcriptional regulator/antitoxin HigA
MTILPIESDKDLTAALARVEKLWPKRNRSEKAAAELKVLSILIEEYERRTAPIPPPTPLDAIRFRMDQLGLKTIALAERMGTPRSRASEVLNGKRPLTLPMIRKLARNLDISADVLIGIGQ